MAKEDSHFGTSASRPAQHGNVTAGAELAAYKICKTPLDLSGRKTVEGYAIDSADPNSPMDRDDAIGIRYSESATHKKLTTLDISIADVASNIPPKNKPGVDFNLTALDASAFKNGETLYFSHGASPMLPRRLQDRLSLENGRDRGAITTSVTFDEHHRPLHTEFARTHIQAKCKSYRDAARDILLYGHPIQQISVVANQFLGRKSGITDLPHYDPHTGMYTDSEGNIRHISRDELSAFTTVQGSMIAGNEAAAHVMSESNFLFRNHSYSFRNSPVFYSKREMEEFEGSEGRVIQNKAEYSPECKGHFGLNADEYSHITSPMRRYADLVNQRMMLWAIDVVDSITDSTMNDPSWDKEKFPREAVAYAVWDNAKALLGKATALKEAGQHWEIRQKGLEASITETLGSLAPLGAQQASRIAKSATKAVRAIALPYTSKDLTEIAESLNETLAKNRLARREMQFNEVENWLNAVFPEPKANMLRAWGADSFAKLLGAAARRGDNHDTFAAEVLTRLKDDTDMRVQNLYSILVIAQRHKDSHWQALKREAFQMLKDDPQLGEKVFAYMQTRQLPRQQDDSNGPHPRDAQVFILEATLLDRHHQPHPSALVVLSHEERGEKKDSSAPIIDTAETPEKARQAAILTFFRHYGDLISHQQQYTPKLIDLALERATVKKGERMALLRKMCDPYFTLEEQRTLPEDAPRHLDITLTVTNKEGGQSITKTRSGDIKDYEQIADKAAKGVLEDRRFLDMLEERHTWHEADGKMIAETPEELPRVIWRDMPSLQSGHDDSDHVTRR